MNMTEENDLGSVRKKYSWTGFSYFIFTLLMVVSQYPLVWLVKYLGLKPAGNSWLTYLLGLGPIWVIGFPVCLLLMKKLPKKKPQDFEMKPKYLLSFYAMMTTMMIAGNIFGIVLSRIIGIIFGGEVDNSTIELIQKQAFLPTLIFVVILGPVLEELAFRKLLIDSVGQYSKKYSIILSGVMFGLFHTNLYQFFYAALIGFVFAYIYTITGRIRYTIILHSTVNFIHGLLPMILLKNVDMEKLQSIAGVNAMKPENEAEILKLYSNPGFLLFMGYAMLLFLVIIIGLVLLILNFKKMKVDDSGSLLNKSNAFKTVYINIGMILFVLATVGYSIYEIVQQILNG